MIDVIRRFFSEHLEGSEFSEDPDHELRLAAVALLYETALSDYDLGQVEQELIQQLVREQFELTQAEADELLSLAESQVREATDLYGFTSLINQNWSLEQRTALVERMWQVVYADRRLDDHEVHLMRKIERLLHIPHRDFVAAKLRHKPS